MSNLTIFVDDELVRRARVRARQQGTSLSAKVRQFLRDYVSEPDASLRKQCEDDTARLMQTIESATAQANPEPARPAARKRRTLREGLYAGDFDKRNKTLR